MLSWVLLTLLLLTLRSVQVRLHTQAANCLHSLDKTKNLHVISQLTSTCIIFLQHFTVNDLNYNMN